jgi:hypothetical protein
VYAVLVGGGWGGTPRAMWFASIMQSFLGRVRKWSAPLNSPKVAKLGLVRSVEIGVSSSRSGSAGWERSPPERALNVLILHTARGGTVAGPYCTYVAALIFTLYTADRSGARPVRAAN